MDTTWQKLPVGKLNIGLLLISLTCVMIVVSACQTQSHLPFQHGHIKRQLSKSNIIKPHITVKNTPAIPSKNHLKTTQPYSCISLIKEHLHNEPQLQAFKKLHGTQQNFSQQTIWPRAPQLRGRVDARTPENSARLGTRFYLPWGQTQEKKARQTEVQIHYWQMKDYHLQMGQQLAFSYLDYQVILIQLWVHLQHYMLNQFYLNKAEEAYQNQIISQQELLYQKQQQQTHLLTWYQMHQQAQRLASELYPLSTQFETFALPIFPEVLSQKLDQNYQGFCLDGPIQYSSLSSSKLNTSQHPNILMQQSQANAQWYRSQIDRSLWLEFIDIEWDQQADTDRALVSFGLNFPWYDEKARMMSHEANMLSIQARASQQLLRQQSQKVEYMIHLYHKNLIALQDQWQSKALLKEYQKLKQDWTYLNLQTLHPQSVQKHMPRIQKRLMGMSLSQKEILLGHWQWIVMWYQQITQWEKYWIELQGLQGHSF